MRTVSFFPSPSTHSFIRGPLDDAPLWPIDPLAGSFLTFAPERPKRRRRPPAWRSRADAYAALLTGDEYAEAARDALRAGDNSAAEHALEVLRGIVDVVLAKLRKPSSEYLAITEALQ